MFFTNHACTLFTSGGIVNKAMHNATFVVESVFK